MHPRNFLTTLFNAAVKAADPKAAMAGLLPDPPMGRTIVVGAGKAASEMAVAVESLWEGPLQGVVVDRHGATARPNRIRVIEAAHPVPDSTGLAGAQALFHAVSGLSEQDLVIALISGGGSALLPCPVDGLEFEDEVAVNRALLASGAPIADMNRVRRRLSRIKGGGLALAAAPARVVTFIVSDVAGDDPAIVASGPTILEIGSHAEALDVVARYRLELPERAMATLHAKEAAPNDCIEAARARNSVHIVASAGISLAAAADVARAVGIAPVILSDSIEGEARDIGRMHAAMARHAVECGEPFSPPVVMLSGGETTVTLGAEKPGRGGRNAEFLLSLACDIAGFNSITALAADTDGIDGSENNAGAFADGGTLGRMAARGVDARARLAAHDAWTAFDATDDLFVTGPTGTNINDFRAILIGK